MIAWLNLWSAMFTAVAMKVRPAAERTQKKPASGPVEKIAENRHGKNGNTGNKEFIKSECD